MSTKHCSPYCTSFMNLSQGVLGVTLGMAASTVQSLCVQKQGYSVVLLCRGDKHWQITLDSLYIWFQIKFWLSCVKKPLPLSVLRSPKCHPYTELKQGCIQLRRMMQLAGIWIWSNFRETLKCYKQMINIWSDNMPVTLIWSLYIVHILKY